MRAVCANCGIEFNWQPTIVDGAAYCCIGCSQGGPCCCDYGNLPQPDDPTALASIPEAERAPTPADRRHGSRLCW